jgi:hypothetical protein
METSESPLLIGGRGPGGKFLSGTKKVIIRWSFLELGSYGNIGMLCLVSLKNLLLNSSMPCMMNCTSGKLQVLRGLGP